MCITAPSLARLEIRDEALQAAVEASCPALNVTGRSRWQTLRIVGYSAAALASFLGLVFYGIPLLADRLAVVVPLSFERRLGEAVDRQVHLMFGDKACTGAAGNAALKRLVDKLGQEGGLPMESDVQVLASALPNAFALPGGKIYVLNGLLQKAKEPDELAGVIAHELGHLQHRDGLKRLIRDGGTGFMLGLLFGDVLGGGAVIFATRSLLSGSYSRDAERNADAFAIDTMRGLGRSPKATGNLLLRITGPEGNKSLTILSSHPLTEERLATMTQADRPVSGPELLSAEEWRALQGICR
jgi:Zn-dependent protease with chaperone function